MQKYHRFLEAWNSAIRNSYETLHHELEGARQYRSLAALCEAEGASHLFTCTTSPDEGLQTLVWGALKFVEAGFWHRREGEDLPSRYCGERAMHELESLFGEGGLKTSRPYDEDCIEWYIREFMGDAACLVKPALARSYYEQARAGYETMSQMEHDIQDNEWFPGYVLDEFLNHFVPFDGLRPGYHGRLDQKITFLATR